MALTERRIRDAKPGPRTAIVWDDQVRGLGVRITRGGTKSLILNYRARGRERRATLGRVGEISLKDARERAASILAEVRAGGSGPLEARQREREAPTVAALVGRFLRDHASERMANGRLSERTLREYRQQCDAYILPAIGPRRVGDVTKGDVAALVAKLRPVTRNRVLALVSRMFTLAEHWEWRPQRTNPARGIERSREEARDRTLSGDEITALFAALADTEAGSPMAVAAIRVAAVTGLRIGEVLAMRWEHVDLASRRVLLPETKTGKRSHDLPSAALAVLDGLPRVNGWVFASRDGSHVNYQTVRSVFRKAAGKAGVPDVRLHDLRRTVMTRAAMAGVGVHVLRDLLGHKTTAIADRYIRAVGNPVREARESVGGEIAAIMAGNEPCEVTPIRKARG